MAAEPTAVEAVRLARRGRRARRRIASRARHGGRRLGWSFGLCLVLAGCGGAADHQGDTQLQATLRLSPTPPMVGSAGVRVTATDGAESVTPPGRVAVSVQGASQAAQELRFEAGAWVGAMDFPAPGEVRVEVVITASDGRWATLALPVRVVRRP